MKAKRILVSLCRVLLGLLFVFSGLAKGVDPMGTAIQFGEYYNAFGLDFLRGTETLFSVMLSTGEAALGLLLVFGIWPRISGTLVAVGMFFFTLLTLYIALTNPVADCGCFGEAVKLSNWGTFYKNALLLFPLSIVVAVNVWVVTPKPWVKMDLFWTAVFIAIPCCISIYGLRHLPLVDFLPYKKGVDLPQALKGGMGSGDETKLVYRDMQSGQVVEFSMSDTTWYDASRWEYVDTIVPETTKAAAAGSFAILDAGADVTLELIDRPGVLMLLCVSDPDKLDAACARALDMAAREAQNEGWRVIAVTPVALEEGAGMLVNGMPVPYYNMDDVTLKSLLRAKNGLVVLDGGVITDKRNCRDIPEYGKFPAYGRE